MSCTQIGSKEMGNHIVLVDSNLLDGDLGPPRLSSFVLWLTKVDSSTGTLGKPLKRIPVSIGVYAVLQKGKATMSNDKLFVGHVISTSPLCAQPPMLRHGKI